MKKICRVWFAAILIWGAFLGAPASAVQMDWSGQFWLDQQWLNNYQLDKGRPGYDADPAYYNAGGPYVPGTGEKNVVWYSAFLRLKPKLIVNDSIHIKSEWHVGSPLYGFLGRDFAASGGEQYNFTSSQKGNAALSVARFWASIITDFGTVDMGRAPLHWGLGAMWNAGDNLFDHYQSSGDMIRLTSKFGNLSISPAISKVAMGNNAAGAADTSSVPTSPGLINPKAGNDDVTDYHMAVKYDNTEEDFDFGLMWTRRTGNAAQSSILLTPSNSGVTSKRLNFNLFDFYARKKLGHFTLGGEVPLFTGTIGGIDGSANDFEYKTVAFIFEGLYTSDMWDIELKAGHVPGQPVVDPDRDAAGNTTSFIDKGSKYRPVYLNKNYGLGLIMFHYNLYGLGGNNPDNLTTNQLRSPYDNPIVNANYLALTPTLKFDKWSFNSTLVFAWADAIAPNNPGGSSSKKVYNTNRRQFFDLARDNGGQTSFLGWEWDFGTKFKWDEHFSLGWTLGLWFPGGYWGWANLPNTSLTTNGFMFASQVQAGISF